MILAVTEASTGTIGVVIIAALLCVVGLIVAWASYENPKRKKARLDFELKQAFRDIKKNT